MLLNRDRADEIMDREQVETLVVSTPINTYYVSSWATDPSWGFGDLALAILPRDHDKEGVVEIVNDADGRLFSCVAGRTYRVE